MVILLIEDTPEEQEKAKSALRELGFRPAVAATLADAYRIWNSLGEKIVGVATDMMFPSGHFVGDAGVHACGLAVIARAVKMDLPVVVCSNLDHHGVTHLTDVIRMLSEHPGYSYKGVPFLMDRKNWHRAGEDLLKLIQEKQA